MFFFFLKVTHSDERCVASCIVLVRILALLIQGFYFFNLTISYFFFFFFLYFDILFSRISLLFQKGQTNYNKIAEEAINRGHLYLKCHNSIHISDFFRHVSASNLEELELGKRREIGYTFKALGCCLVVLRSNMSYEEV